MKRDWNSIDSPGLFSAKVFFFLCIQDLQGTSSNDRFSLILYKILFVPIQQSARVGCRFGQLL